MSRTVREWNGLSDCTLQCWTKSSFVIVGTLLPNTIKPPYHLSLSVNLHKLNFESVCIVCNRQSLVWREIDQFYFCWTNRNRIATKASGPVLLGLFRQSNFSAELFLNRINFRAAYLCELDNQLAKNRTLQSTTRYQPDRIFLWTQQIQFGANHCSHHPVNKLSSRENCDFGSLFW